MHKAEEISSHSSNGPEGNAPYPLAIRILHWIMAVTILGLIALGWIMTPWSLATEHLYFWHKSFGMLMLFLIFARIVIRRRSSVPPLPSSLRRWEITAAKISHGLLYFLMLAVPLAGYVDSSAYKYSSGIHFFFIDLPQLVPDNDMLQKAGNLLHKIFAYSLLAVVAVHAAGAIKHRFFDSDRSGDVFPRILFGWRGGKSGDRRPS